VWSIDVEHRTGTGRDCRGAGETEYVVACAEADLVLCRW